MSCLQCEKLNSYINNGLIPPLNYIMELYQDHLISLIAGDGYVENMHTDLRSERYFTYEYYFNCSSCNTIYYLGLCIRGTPVFKIIKDLSKCNLKRMHGRYGSYFNSKWED